MNAHAVAAVLSNMFTSFRSLCAFWLMFLAVNESSGTAADLFGKSVEVYNTGGIGLRAWMDQCSGTYAVKPDGERGVVVSPTSELCGGYNRWRVKWNNDSVERWSAEDWLRVVPPDLTISSAVEVSPSSPSAGGQITVGCTISNQGDGNAVPSSTKILLLRIDPFDISLTEDMIETANIDARSSIGFEYRLTLPSDLASGRYQVSIEVDSLGSIGQTVFNNDVKTSAEFSVSTQRYTVTAAAGKGGTISPSGTQFVGHLESITFTATADSLYAVQEWLVNGSVYQTGGTSFQLSSIVNDASVLVTFKPKTGRLEILSSNGFVSKLPDLSDYPVGTQVLLTPNPNPGYVFASWGGAASGAGQPLTITVYDNVTVTADFVPSPSPLPVGYSIGGGGSGIQSLSIKIPGVQSVYLFLLQISKDYGRNWFIFDATLGKGNVSSPPIPMYPAGELAMCRLEITIPPTEPPFLIFPIKGWQDPYIAPISAIFDHNESKGIMRTYRNEEAQGKFMEKSDEDPTLVGFKKDASASPFDLRFNYSDKTILWYDDHTGYDYPATRETEVVAAADGYLDLELTASQKEWGGVVIRHANSYRTFYLHLGKLSDKVQSSMAIGDPVALAQGETIGWAGNTGLTGAKDNERIHLHFTVKDSGGKRVDPYGSFSQTGVLCQPILWVFPAPN